MRRKPKRVGKLPTKTRRHRLRAMWGQGHDPILYATLELPGARASSADYEYRYRYILKLSLLYSHLIGKRRVRVERLSNTSCVFVRRDPATHARSAAAAAAATSAWKATKEADAEDAAHFVTTASL